VKERGANMQQYDWQSHDIKIIFGDLNFRNIGSLDQQKQQKLIQ